MDDYLVHRTGKNRMTLVGCVQDKHDLITTMSRWLTKENVDSQNIGCIHIENPW